MNWLFSRLQQFHEDQTAVTSTEYVVILVLIGCASIVMLQMLGGWTEEDGKEGALRSEVFSKIHEGGVSAHSEMSTGKIRGGLSADVD